MVAEALIAAGTALRPVGQVCPLCGLSGIPWGTQDGFPIRSCCGTLLSWPWNSVAEYEAWYSSSEFHGAHQEAIGFAEMRQRDGEYLLAAAHRLRVLRGLFPQVRRVLDVGAGTGAWVGLLHSQGYQVQGWEPGETLASWARLQGRPVETGGWQDARDRGQELVSLHDVLEHLTEPEACLAHLARLLAPAGVLVVEMPEAFAPEPSWKRHLKPREHICLYSRGAAERLYERVGLRVLAFTRPLGGRLGKMSHWLARG